jgi:hypothetical protein
MRETGHLPVERQIPSLERFGNLSAFQRRVKKMRRILIMAFIDGCALGVLVAICTLSPLGGAPEPPRTAVAYVLDFLNTPVYAIMSPLDYALEGTSFYGGALYAVLSIAMFFVLHALIWGVGMAVLALVVLVPVRSFRRKARQSSDKC